MRSQLILIIIFSLTIAQRVLGTSRLDISEKGSDVSTDSRFQAKSNRNIDKDCVSETTELECGDSKDKHNDNSLIALPHLEATRRKRSIFIDHVYGSRGKAGLKLAKYIKALRNIYGTYEPAIRTSSGLKQLQDPLRNIETMKRIASDYGYGSRLQAAENIAQSRSHADLFGIAGPGKRGMEMPGLTHAARTIGADHGYMLRNTDLIKRIASEIVYGSRSNNADNAGKQIGIHGPGMWDRELAVTGDIPDSVISLFKRIATDYGYGSRVQAAENAAQSATHGHVFGIYGPGKRGMPNTQYMYMDKEVPALDLYKRVTSDFGYGSREQTAEKLANSSGKSKVFGKHGPGKRSSYVPGHVPLLVDFVLHNREGNLIADSGSRSQTGSQIANDLVENLELVVDNEFVV